MIALTLRGCFLSRGYQKQPHGLAAFPASVQLPKLAVDPVPAQVPKQIIVPVSPQLPVQRFRVNTVVVSRSIHKCLNWRLIGSRFDICSSLGATAQVQLAIVLVFVPSAVVGVPVFALATTQLQTLRVQSLTGV